MPRTLKSTIATVFVFFCCISLLAACNGGAGGTGPKPTATFGPAVKTRLAEDSRRPPTRTPTPQGAAQAATPLPPTATTQPATPTPQRLPLSDPSTEVLLTALLTADEMPEGWFGGETLTQDELGEDWSGDDDMLVSPGSEDYCGSDFDDPYLNQTAVLFERGDPDWLVLQYISLYANAQSADLMLSQMFAAMERCPEFDEMIDGQVSRTLIQPLDYPAMGDRSAAYLMTSSSDDFEIELVLAAFRIDRVITFVVQFGLSEYSGPIEEWGTQDIALRAHEKIHSLWELIDSLERSSPNVV